MYRERLTITLDPELTAAIDQTVDGSLIRNRSHAIEHLVREGLALHALTHAVLLLTEEPILPLSEYATFLEKNHITHCYIVPPAGKFELGQLAAASMAQIHSLTTQVVPGDFGSGGALILQQASLQNPFLLVETAQTAPLPTSLAAAYTFHRQQHHTLTQLVHPTNECSYLASGISIAEPSLIAEIPAGIVSLEKAVFPALLKAGKVDTYVY